MFAHFGSLLFLRILDLSYFCAFWISLIFAHFGPFLFLRILNSINYDCPCIHFIVAQYYFQYFANFLHPSFIIQSIILHLANFLQSSLIDQGLLYFANVIHLSIDQGFFAFREYLTFIFSSIRPFSCISRISYIHLFIVQGLFCTFLNLFIHFFHCASIFLHFGH